jgi:hypothetical protein
MGGRGVGRDGLGCDEKLARRVALGGERGGCCWFHCVLRSDRRLIKGICERREGERRWRLGFEGWW